MHRPSRPGAYGVEASVASCARSVTHRRDALPHVLVGSLAPAADAANMLCGPPVQGTVTVSAGRRSACQVLDHAEAHVTGTWLDRRPEVVDEAADHFVGQPLQLR